MKALVLTEYNTFEYKDMSMPQISPQGVSVQVKAWESVAAMCMAWMVQ